jgi:hypothetical protein
MNVDESLSFFCFQSLRHYYLSEKLSFVRFFVRLKRDKNWMCQL